MNTLQRFFNQLTGYHAVSLLKHQVLLKDALLQQKRQALKKVKNHHQSLLHDRLKTQKEIHHLLQRQASWLDTDLNQFTNLYRKDLALEQQESQSLKDYNKMEEEFDIAHSDYLNSIRERYVEEQMYSDKIRRASTWWTLIHLGLFIYIQIMIEPKKRSDLVYDISQLLKDYDSQSTKSNDDPQTQQAFVQTIHPTTDQMSILPEFPAFNSFKDLMDKPKLMQSIQYFKQILFTPLFLQGFSFASFCSLFILLISRSFT